MRIVFAGAERLADNAEFLLCQIGIHKQPDERLIIVCGIAELTVHRLTDLRKPDGVHIQPVIECRCNVLIFVDIIACLFEQLIDNCRTASVMLLDDRVLRNRFSLREPVMVNDNYMFRRKAPDISLSVKAVNRNQKLRQSAVFIQVFHMADLNAELVQHNQHIGLADFAFSGINKARLFPVFFQIAAKSKSGSNRIGIRIVMRLNDNIIIVKQMFQQRFVFHKIPYSFSVQSDRRSQFVTFCPYTSFFAQCRKIRFRVFQQLLRRVYREQTDFIPVEVSDIHRIAFGRSSSKAVDPVANRKT